MYCKCGCGEVTKISPHTNIKQGYIKGQHRSYLHGHHIKINNPNSKGGLNRYEIDSVTQCWNWTGPTDKDGYAQSGTKKYNTRRAARIIYQEKLGELPKDTVLDHKCSNRLCVNPNHLEPVSQVINVRRGRGTILTIEQVSSIRELIKTHGVREISKMFGVSTDTIRDICHHKTWRNV